MEEGTIPQSGAVVFLNNAYGSYKCFIKGNEFWSTNYQYGREANRV